MFGLFRQLILRAFGGVAPQQIFILPLHTNNGTVPLHEIRIVRSNSQVESIVLTPNQNVLGWVY